jgi:hypothetical protein
MTSGRQVAEEPQPNGNSFSAAHLHGGSADSLATDSLGRQIDPSERGTDGYGTSNTEEPQRPAAAARGGALLPGTSLEDVVQESPFLDLSSPMTGYEWFKAVLLAPWAAFKFLLSVAGLVLVWAVTRVCARARCKKLHHTLHECTNVAQILRTPGAVGAASCSCLCRTPNVLL